MSSVRSKAPEFDSNALDSLRQPLESGEMLVARSGFSVRFPARFHLVMAMNPCPCGRGGAGSVGLATTGVSGVVSVEGVGDAVPLELAIERIGRATLPLSPVHLRGVWQDDGGLALRWMRRSRSGFAWIDGVDAPLDTGSERYRLAWRAAALTGSIETSATEALLAASEIATLRAAGPWLSVAVAQIGDAGLSPVAQRDFALG